MIFFAARLSLEKHFRMFSKLGAPVKLGINFDVLMAD